MRGYPYSKGVFFDLPHPLLFGQHDIDFQCPDILMPHDVLDCFQLSPLNCMMHAKRVPKAVDGDSMNFELP